MTQSPKQPWAKTSRSILLVPAIAVGLVMASLGFQRQSDTQEPGDGSKGDNIVVVSVLTAQQVDSLDTTVPYPGLVKSRQSVELGFSRAGKITRLLVAEGDQVKAGSAIAELSKERLTRRQSSLQTARDRAARSLADLAPDAPAPTAAEMQETISELRTQLNRIAAQVAAVNQTTPGQPADYQLQRQLEVVEARVKGLDTATREQRINELQRVVDELDGQLADVALEIGECQLTSPFGGVIAKRYTHVGAVVSAGMPVVRLVDNRSLDVWLGVPAALAATLQNDVQVTIRIRDRDYLGTLSTILPEIDQTTLARTVIFQLDSDTVADVFPGDVARVELGRRIEGSGFWLPLTALMREARGLWSVFVAEPKDEQWVVSRRYVEVVHLEDDQVLVRGTLSSGDLVIAGGTHRVVAGQQVRCENETTATDLSASQSP